MLLLLGLWAPVRAPGVAEAQGVPGVVVALSRGPVEVQPRGEAAWRVAAVGVSLGPGDRIRASRGGAAELRVVDGSLLRLGEDSELELSELDLDPQGLPETTRFHLQVGKVRAFVARALVAKVQRRAGSFGVTTPTSVIAVRQTDLVVTFNPRTTLYTLDGVVELAAARSGSRSLSVSRNRFSVVEDTQDATTPRPIPRDVRARLLAELPFESAPVPVPGILSPQEAMRGVLGHLVQKTSTERTASAWIWGIEELRLQPAGSVTYGRPNPATSPAPTRVLIRFD